MLFRQLFDQDTWTYTYLIADLKTKEAALVDSVLEQVERDSKLLKELNLKLKYCLETHIHADHITGTGKLREMTGCEGVVPENAHAACADRYIKDGETLQVGDICSRPLQPDIICRTFRCPHKSALWTEEVPFAPIQTT